MCITPLTGGVPGAESDGGGVADEPIPVAVHLADTLGNTQTYTGAPVTHWVELRSVLQLEGPAPAATPTLLRRAEDGGWVGQLQLGAGLGTHEVTAVLCRCAGGSTAVPRACAAARGGSAGVCPALHEGAMESGAGAAAEGVPHSSRGCPLHRRAPCSIEREVSKWCGFKRTRLSTDATHTTGGGDHRWSWVWGRQHSRRRVCMVPAQ